MSAVSRFVVACALVVSGIFGGGVAGAVPAPGNDPVPGLPVYLALGDSIANGAVSASVASAPGMWVSQSGPERVRWSWTALPGVSGYRVAVSKSATFSNAKIRVVQYRWSTFTGLKPGTIYYAAVRGLYGSSTSAVSGKTGGIPGRVQKPLGRPPSNPYAGIAWSWAPYVGAAKYQVWMAQTSSFTSHEAYLVTKTSVTLEAERDSTFWFKARALNASGSPVSDWSPTAKATTPYYAR